MFIHVNIISTPTIIIPSSTQQSQHAINKYNNHHQMMYQQMIKLYHLAYITYREYNMFININRRWEWSYVYYLMISFDIDCCINWLLCCVCWERWVDDGIIMVGVEIILIWTNMYNKQIWLQIINKHLSHGKWRLMLDLPL